MGACLEFGFEVLLLVVAVLLLESLAGAVLELDDVFEELEVLLEVGFINMKIINY